MDLFDEFKKRKSSSENRQSAKEKFNRQQTDKSLGMSIRGETLNLVYEHAIKGGTFIVPKNVHRIGMFAFSRLKNLETVILHDNVNYIGEGAFRYCENLKNIELPFGIEVISSDAFLECSSLEKITLPYGCWSIGRNAFAGCGNLQLIQIPATMELIESEAFAGCTKANISFLEDGKILLSDYINEQKAINRELYGADFENQESSMEFDGSEGEPPPPPTLEEKAQLYDDFNIRYRIIDIAGQKFMWPHKPLEIRSNALSGVREIFTHSESKSKAIMDSGYKGKISLVCLDDNRVISIDLKAMTYYEEELKKQKREKFYSQFLIPAGGTTNWLINCEKNHYNALGYSGKTIWEMPIFEDAKIEVVDYTQPKSSSNKYAKEYDEFFTSVSFHKKEIIVGHKDGPQEYDRTYSVYYPYGARFDTQMLIQAGIGLSALMDTARDLPDTAENQEQLKLIALKQKQIIDLFLNGTNNPNAILDIMVDENLILSPISHTVKVAKYQKDYLPYFTSPLFSDLKEFEEYRKNRKSNNPNQPKQKD